MLTPRVIQASAKSAEAKASIHIANERAEWLDLKQMDQLRRLEQDLREVQGRTGKGLEGNKLQWFSA